MSTLQLGSAILRARSPDGEDGVRPSPRLLARMAREWDERPDADRLAAEALLRHP